MLEKHTELICLLSSKADVDCRFLLRKIINGRLLVGTTGSTRSVVFSEQKKDETRKTN